MLTEETLQHIIADNLKGYYGFAPEPEQIKSYLFANGFVWSEDQQQFRPIGYDTRA